MTRRGEGEVREVSGSVVVASRIGGAAIYDLVQVGAERLIGEIIRLEVDTITIQVYGDTYGLTVGDTVIKPPALEHEGMSKWQYAGSIGGSTDWTDEQAAAYVGMSKWQYAGASLGA